MSRWQNTFETHGLQSKWTKIMEITSTLKIETVNIPSDVEELARLKKTILYIDDFLKACDPELIHPQTWNNFDSQAQNLLSALQEFNRTKLVQKLQESNAYIDHLLSYVSPYITDSKKAARSAAQTYRQYTKVINEEISRITKYSAKSVEEIEELRVKSKSLHKSIREIQMMASDFERDYVQDGGVELSLKEKISALYDTSVSYHHDILDLYNNLLTSSDEHVSVKRQIADLYEKIKETAQETDDLKSGAEVIKDELEDFNLNVLGVIDEDGVQGQGLKKELKTLMEDLTSFKSKQEVDYIEIVTEIRKLLPEATSAGLSFAYEAMRRNFYTPIRQYSRLFYFSIFAIITVTLFSQITDMSFNIPQTTVDTVNVTQEDENLLPSSVDTKPLFSITWSNSHELKDIAISLTGTLPFILPFIWLAIYATRRRAEVLRLQQEYSHKATLAKTFYSYKKQIEELDDGSSELMKELLKASIDAVSFNASVTLDQKNKESHPLSEITFEGVDKVIDIANKLTPLAKLNKDNGK